MTLEGLCKQAELDDSESTRDALLSIYESIDLNDAAGIGRFGALSIEPADVGHKHNEATEGLSVRIGSLVSSLEAADPRVILKRKNRFNFIDRFRGTDAISKLEYIRSTQLVDTQLAEVPKSIERIESSIESLQQTIKQMTEELSSMRCHFVGGQWYLQENPGAGVQGQTMYGLDSARERFQKRLMQLMLVITSNETGLHQLNLMRANSLNLLDRLHEITNVLVPTWRSQRIGLYASDQDFDAFSHATEAHEALVASLRHIQ